MPYLRRSHSDKFARLREDTRDKRKRCSIVGHIDDSHRAVAFRRRRELPRGKARSYIVKWLAEADGRKYRVRKLLQIRSIPMNRRKEQK